MAKRKQPSLTIDEAFQRFYQQEKNPHAACEWFNQALREGLTLWVVDLRVLPPEEIERLRARAQSAEPAKADAVSDYFATPPGKRQPAEVTADYFASYYRVVIEQAPDSGWHAKMKTTARATMPADQCARLDDKGEIVIDPQFKWTVSAPGVNSLAKSELLSGRKRGPKVKFEWASINREITRRCFDEKTGRVQVPENEGKLAKDMLDWCGTKFEEIPSDWAMREAVKKICAMLRPG
jgi:hypothetical protein